MIMHMVKRGQRPKGKVRLKWSPHFAYAIGLIASDGNLSTDGRHINFTSKDIEQIKNFKKALDIDNSIGKKSRGAGKEKKYFVVQFGDVLFCNFLIKIGITQAKSKTLGSLLVPDKYFFDFLRGFFDGDGHSYSYWDKRWRSSFLFYIGFSSASLEHIHWIQNKLNLFLDVKGRVKNSNGNACYQLEYAKTEAKIIVAAMYKRKTNICLSRKRLKIEKSLVIMARPRKIRYGVKK